MLLKGKTAAPGIVIGRVLVYKKNNLLPQEKLICKDEVESHLNLYQEIKKLAKDEIENLKSTLQKENLQKAEIFDAHHEIIDDVIINEEITLKIKDELMPVDRAIYHIYETVIDALQKTSDPTFVDRCMDFKDVRSRFLRLHNGEKYEGLDFLEEPVIIAAENLLPSDTALMDVSKVQAILTETGGITSHAAIIAKSYGIPTVVGISGLIDNLKDGRHIIVNATEGVVIIDPTEDQLDEYSKKNHKQAGNSPDIKAVMTDEIKIDIGLNISDASDEEIKYAAYTDFVGLFRTEFLYMGRAALPCEEEQISVYRRILEAYGGRPVILRTLDIGGDKELPYLCIPREENPFLGNRGVRFCFNNPQIFKTQLRACLRAAVYGNLWVMFPMVSSFEEIGKVKKYIEDVKVELQKEKIVFGKIKTGIMIETPSIALIAGIAAKEVDFASIGSNDLCQYLCAADRMNPLVENYYQSYHPAMFRLIKETAAAFNKEGKPISICGELGGDQTTLAVLIGLGLRKFSMGAASVAAIKKRVTKLSLKKCEDTAEKVLKLSTAAEINKFLEKLSVNH